MELLRDILNLIWMTPVYWILVLFKVIDNKFSERVVEILPTDRDINEIEGLLLAWVEEYMAPHFDPSQTEFHEVMEAYRDTFNDTDRFLASIGEGTWEKNQPFTQYGLIEIHDSRTKQKKALILDADGFHEITMEDYDQRSQSRKNNSFTVWAFHSFYFLVDENYQSVLVSHGDCSMAMSLYTEKIIRTEKGKLLLEYDSSKGTLRSWCNWLLHCEIEGITAILEKHGYRYHNSDTYCRSSFINMRIESVGSLTFNVLVH